MKSTTRFTKNIRGIECLNCKQPISSNDNFCSNCGQVNDELPLSIKQFISEFFSGFFSFDTRFFKTFIPLLFKPGKVSREYIEGKRRRYVNPFQLYLHVTILYFLIQGLFLAIDEYKISDFSSNDDITLVEKDSILNNVEQELAKNNINLDLFVEDEPSEKTKLSSENQAISKLVDKSVFKKISDFMTYDEKYKDATIPEALKELNYKKTSWNIFYYKKAQDFNKMKVDADFRNALLNDVVSKISIALFFMLPIFTLFLSLLYVRHKYNYTEHLVFVFNVQTVFFILLIVFTVFNIILTTDSGMGLFILLFLFYLYKSLRDFYKQGRIKTIIKYFLLNTIFVFLSIIGGIIISFIAFAL